MNCNYSRRSAYGVRFTVTSSPANLCAIVRLFISAWWNRRPIVALIIANDSVPPRVTDLRGTEMTCIAPTVPQAQEPR